MFQERDFQGRNWEPFPCDPHDLGAVVLTHAHLDHCVLLPKLVKEGFNGKIYATAPTAEIAQIVLEDSGFIQEEDAKHKRYRHAREGRQGRFPEQPLYTASDAKDVLKHWAPVEPGTPVILPGGMTARFINVGHIFGAASILIEGPAKGGTASILMSGDIGRWGRPLINDPDTPPAADYVVTEATYGDRMHDDPAGLEDQFATIVKETLQAGGNLVIPSFAVERSHELLYFLNDLLMKGQIPRCPMFLDSPMAINVTNVFKRHVEALDIETRRLIGAGHSPFSLPGLKMTRKPEESKEINTMRGVIVIAGAGMCNGGRIKHHLQYNLPRPESTVLFVGYQVEGTLGRQLCDGAKEIRLFGEKIPVRCRVAKLEGFSGHADKEELIRWISGVPNKPKKVFVCHAEAKTAVAYAATLHERKGFDVAVPSYLDSVELEGR
jgi:metallo-beta-lactamase family protein